MTVLQSRPPFRIFLYFIAVLALLVYLRNPQSIPAMSTSTRRDGSEIVSKLDVSIRQTETSPLSMVIKVTNRNDEPVTFVTYDSPLDPLAFQLGLLRITPDGSDKPLNMPVIAVRRMMPPPAECVVVLAPGESKEQEVEAIERLLPTSKLKGGATVACKGQWHNVWPGNRKELVVTDESAGESALQGEFESDAIRLTVG